MRPKGPRDLYAGPDDGPNPPFPITLSGPVIKGFGRGSRELGIPTANIPPSGLAAYPDLQSGVYFGFVGLRLTPDTTQLADNSKLTLSASPSTLATSTAPEASATTNDESRNAHDHDNAAPTSERLGVYPAVLSIGYNPYYANPTRSIEIHILHSFPRYNFYHAPLNLLILGFIRPEYDYESLEALVDDIKTDCEVARRSLERKGYLRWMGIGEDGGEGEAAKAAIWLRQFGWMEEVDVEGVEGEVLKGDKNGGGEGSRKVDQQGAVGNGGQEKL